MRGRNKISHKFPQQCLQLTPVVYLLFEFHLSELKATCIIALADGWCKGGTCHHPSQYYIGDDLYSIVLYALGRACAHSIPAKVNDFPPPLFFFGGGGWSAPNADPPPPPQPQKFLDPLLYGTKRSSNCAIQ